MPDPEAIERIYDAHAAALFAFALHLTRSDADAKDLVQEVFVKLARRPLLPGQVDDPRAFLLRALRNAFFDASRRRQTRNKAAECLAREPASPFAPTPDPDELAFRTAIAAALAGVPEEQSTVVYLKIWEGMTFEAIALLLEIPPDTAASRYRYGLDKIRRRLRPLYAELQ